MKIVHAPRQNGKRHIFYSVSYANVININRGILNRGEIPDTRLPIPGIEALLDLTKSFDITRAERKGTLVHILLEDKK